MGNRFYGLISSFLLALLTNRIFVVDWAEADHMRDTWAKVPEGNFGKISSKFGRIRGNFDHATY
jgi:hypothetical protein